MSWQTIVATVAEAVLNAVQPARSPARAPASSARVGVTATGLAAFVSFAGPIIRIVEGKGSLGDDVSAANAVMDAIATFDPAAAPFVALAQAAEPAFAAIVGLALAGGVTGGYPDIGAEENATNFKNR